VKKGWHGRCCFALFSYLKYTYLRIIFYLKSISGKKSTKSTKDNKTIKMFIFVLFLLLIGFRAYTEKLLCGF